MGRRMGGGGKDRAGSEETEGRGGADGGLEAWIGGAWGGWMDYVGYRGSWGAWGGRGGADRHGGVCRDGWGHRQTHRCEYMGTEGLQESPSQNNRGAARGSLTHGCQRGGPAGAPGRSQGAAAPCRGAGTWGGGRGAAPRPPQGHRDPPAWGEPPEAPQHPPALGVPMAAGQRLGRVWGGAGGCGGAAVAPPGANLRRERGG